MIDAPTLLSDLTRLVRQLEDDLHDRARQRVNSVDRLRRDYERGIEAERTSAEWALWLDDRLAQTAMAWVLGTVFVRFAEDNGLLSGPPRLGGRTAGMVPPTRDAGPRSTAPDRSFSHRDWLLSVFDEVAATPAGAMFLDPEHNPLYHFSISDDAAKELVEFWRRQYDDDRPVYDFTDPALNTYFLADLYQDLSEAARRSYALVQTPQFVSDLILDLTLEPAIAEFGHEHLRIVDPACGSGQFVLGAFQRLVREWREHAPELPATERVRRALDAVHGVDITPCAAAITRFRLLIAALRAAEIPSFEGTQELEWHFHVAVGDALLGKEMGWDDAPFSYATEDLGEREDMLASGSYQVVVCNPPYLTVRDRLLQKRHRELYPTCKGTYSLVVPFTQRFYELASRGRLFGVGAGYVGQLTANSFMKREFGRVLAEEFLAKRVTLTHVIDTSGVFIPGHGTPTAILVGRNEPATRGQEVFAIVSLRGEPEVPAVPEHGRVWQSIREHIGKPGQTDAWTQSLMLKHESFRSHPWNLAGSAVTDVLNKISQELRLEHRVARIGYQANTGSDDLFTGPPHTFRRLRTENDRTRIAVISGSEVRDWTAISSREAFCPRDGRSTIDIERYPRHLARLWPYRTVLGKRPNYTTRSYFVDGRRWYDWHHIAVDETAHPWSIVFSWVATHNQFALLRGSVAALHSAPVIKLPGGTSEQRHIELLALLNSSAVCFWLKQHSSNKGRPTPDQTGTGEPWTRVYEFTATRLGQLPLPEEFPERCALELDRVARELATTTPASVLASGLATRERLATARDRWDELRSRMVSLQEELDWEVYGLYGLLPDGDDLDNSGPVPPIHPGERAFEIVLARRARTGEFQTTWFERGGTRQITDPPQHWPIGYRKVIEQRIRAIERDPTINALERPEFKRRWMHDDWDKMLHAALREWLLDRCESTELWFDTRDGAAWPAPLTIDELADRLRSNHLVLEAADMYRPGAALTEVLAEIVEGEHVPYLAALRYRESGLAKRTAWENVWQLQRQEDEARAAGNDARANAIRDRIDVPPKYSSADFAKASNWRHRGKYDVPNERFVSYPGAGSSDRQGLLIGWAGWDYATRGQVLSNLIEKKLEEAEGINLEELRPLLAGLREILPWLRSRESSEALLHECRRRFALTDADLTSWRPPKARGGRPRKNP